MVKTLNLSYAYKQSKTLKFPDIDLAPRDHLLVIGPSGAGKTTLLHLMAGLLPALQGSISIDGTVLDSLIRRQLDRFRGEHMGIIFQEYYFIKSLNVFENLKLRQNYPSRSYDKKRLFELVERLGLSENLYDQVTALSKGQQQRLGIALGLIHKPKVVFADEPTSNLDDLNCTKVVNLLKEEAEICKSSLIIITHDQRVMSHFNNQISL
ncbi:MAG: ABC transporter ATP-binding protein [Flavobacteriaceae bacterium]|nr:ABC transporter ATP-binding protein [Flavobacteriaceae bacterium]